MKNNISESVGNFVMAYKILKDISRPFDDYEAYDLGLIDKKGKKIKNAETDKEKDAVDSYHRMIFNMKRLAGKMLGQSKLSRATVTLLLLKENLNPVVINKINQELDYPELIHNKLHREALVESSIVDF